jgi:prephenate dehydratase
MNLKIAHLGPPGTYAEQAAFLYLNWLNTHKKLTNQETLELCPYSSIAKSLQAVADKQAEIAVVPVENSIEGSVNMTLDSLWKLDKLKIKLALVLPIQHTLISHATSVDTIENVYSHPQALAQCQEWLSQFLPNVNLIPSNSTTEALDRLGEDLTAAAISSSRAAQLYNLPIMARGINDYPENCTRFWVVSTEENNPLDCTHTTLAFSLAANIPGALMKVLEVFARLGLNLSRIESRPTKRSLGEYLFYLDIEADANGQIMKSALEELQNYTEILKIFGSYSVLPISL